MYAHVLNLISDGAMFVFRLKSLNFLLLIFLLLCVQKRINVQKNESERAGKAFCCFNFLSILNLPINLNFVRARFEFDVIRLNVCVLKTLNFWLSHSRIFLRTKADKCAKKIKASVHIKPFVRCHCYCRLYLWLLVLQKLKKHKRTNFRLFQ